MRILYPLLFVAFIFIAALTHAQYDAKLGKYSKTNKFTPEDDAISSLGLHRFSPKGTNATAYTAAGLAFTLNKEDIIFLTELLSGEWQGKSGNWIMFYPQGSRNLKVPDNADDCYVFMTDMMDLEEEFAASPEKREVFNELYKAPPKPKPGTTREEAAYMIGFAGLLLATGGALMMRNAHRLVKGAARYKFENRTSGGVVEYSSFGNYEHHLKNEQRAKVNYFISLVILPFGIFLVGAAIYLFINRYG